MGIFTKAKLKTKTGRVVIAGLVFLLAFNLYACKNNLVTNTIPPILPPPSPNFGYTPTFGDSTCKVFIGSGIGFDDMVANADKWIYVRQRVDGYYTNHITIKALTATKLKTMGDLLTNKFGYIESDMRAGQSDEKTDQSFIDKYLIAGFTVPYTSLNYGFSVARADNLRNYRGSRVCLLQTAPWALCGNVLDLSCQYNGTSVNQDIKTNFDLADGLSTDNPLGFWFADYKSIKAGSVSLAKLANDNKKIVSLMMAPYDAGNKSYDYSKWLATVQECIKYHENSGKKVDVWNVFSYNVSVADMPYTPESNVVTTNGVDENMPANTVTGGAYWLLKRLHAQTKVGVTPGFTSPNFTSTGAKSANFKVSLTATTAFEIPLQVFNNGESWEEACPVIKIQRSNDTNWDIKYLLNGVDITAQVTNGFGFPCISTYALKGGKKHDLKIVVKSKTGAPANTNPTKIILQLKTHPWNYAEKCDEYVLNGSIL